MRVVIAGASGLIGNFLLEECLNDESINTVFALVRKPLKVQHDKLKQISVDYDNLTESVLPDQIDVLFNCLGTTLKKAKSHEEFRKVDLTYVSRLASIAAQKKVTKFISVSSMGAKKNSKVFYYQVKGEAEDFIMNDSGLENVFIVRPSLLLGEREEFRMGELIGKVAMRIINFLFVGNMKRYKAIHGRKVARAMLILAGMKEGGKKIIQNDALFTLGNMNS